MSIEWVDKADLYYKVCNKIVSVDIVLDIGTGINPQEYIEPGIHICCEPYDEYLEVLLQKTKIEFKRHKTKYVLIKATWSEIVKLIPEKSVDSIFLIDVIEHLKKEEARELLKQTQQLATTQIIVFTPLGFMPQKHEDGKDAWGLKGVAWQEHLSGWEPDDFDNTWDIIATKKYHYKDNLGNKLETPYGAFWAIKTFSKENPINNKTKLVSSRISRAKVHRWLDKLLNLFS